MKINLSIEFVEFGMMSQPQVILDVPAVPQLNSMIRTERGLRKVSSLIYDYRPEALFVVVTVYEPK